MHSILSHHGVTPDIGEGVHVHPSAEVIGEVRIGAQSSVWCKAVIRADVNHIHIGRGTNIQDLSMLHVSHKSAADPLGAPLIIGDYVTVGHSVILHGCEIGNECLIGMGSIVMDKVVIEPRVLVGAGSLVPEGKRLESGFLYLGRPAKPIRRLNEAELSHFRYSADHYMRLAESYKA